MWAIYWLALVAFATGATYCYAFKPRRLYLSSGSASAAWAIAAITAPATFTVTDGGGTVPIGAPLELQLFATGMAVFSLLILTLFYGGYYPPESTDNDPAA